MLAPQIGYGVITSVTAPPYISRSSAKRVRSYFNRSGRECAPNGMADFPSPSPLALPHILIQTLSYASPQTLGRCMAVSSYWYDIAATFLWAHISYRVNPYLRDPGVTPFLPVRDGDEMRGLRRAKRRAVRHVKVVEMRKHLCEEVGCEGMTLHGEESEEDDGDEGDITTKEPEPGLVQNASVSNVDRNSKQTADKARVMPQLNQQKLVLLALRLHIDDPKTISRIFTGDTPQPRPIPFPCPFVSRLDANTIVLVPMRQLSTPRPLPLPSPPSLRKLVVLLIPPTHVPGEFRLADTIPASVEEIVIYLWRRHAASNYDSFRGAWARQMGQRNWGPDKIWGHWCNLILASSPLGFELPNEGAGAENRKTRRYVFVGTGGVDPLWLDLADNNRNRPVFPEQDPGADPALYEQTQKRFEAGMRACLLGKIKERRERYTGERGGGGEDWEAQVKDCLDNVRFLSREDYLAEGKWRGEFTQDEVLYHG